METVFNPIGINRIFEERIRIVARILDTVTRSKSTNTQCEQGKTTCGCLKCYKHIYLSRKARTPIVIVEAFKTKQKITLKKTAERERRRNGVRVEKKRHHRRSFVHYFSRICRQQLTERTKKREKER